MTWYFILLAPPFNIIWIRFEAETLMVSKFLVENCCAIFGQFQKLWPLTFWPKTVLHMSPNIILIPRHNITSINLKDVIM